MGNALEEFHAGSIQEHLDTLAFLFYRSDDQRKALDGVIYRMRSGVQWNQLPKEFGDDSSVHRTFQRWVKRDVIGRLWALLIKGCEELRGVDWKWQSFDCALGKARHGGIKSERTQPIERRTGPSAAC